MALSSLLSLYLVKELKAYEENAKTGLKSFELVAEKIDFSYSPNFDYL
jgi:hypothetical protein